jgi:Arc/MetJ-type ribon-helix-helix transcriptional regulator
MSAWKVLLDLWKRSAELLEDHEDRTILREWLSRRQAGEADMVDVEDFEQELRADGLL